MKKVTIFIALIFAMTIISESQWLYYPPPPSPPYSPGIFYHSNNNALFEMNGRKNNSILTVHSPTPVSQPVPEFYSYPASISLVSAKYFGEILNGYSKSYIDFSIKTKLPYPLSESILKLGAINTINCGPTPFVGFSDPIIAGLSFSSSGPILSAAASDESIEVFRIIDGKMGLGFDGDGQSTGDFIPRHLLDVRGTISTGGYSRRDREYYDGTVTFYPSLNNSWYHIQNREAWGFVITGGKTPGYLREEGYSQPPKGITDFINIYSWAKQVGIGCNPMPLAPASNQFNWPVYDSYDGTVKNLDYTFNPAGPTGMLTVSDWFYPWYSSSEPDPTHRWRMFHGNNVILRLERRTDQIFEGDKDYKLISAGHNSAETFVVKADGRVWIGNQPTTTDFKLSVDGKIVTKEVEVTLEYWPDYVFNSNYKLPTLSEIKSFIDINKHLPNIPSEKEVLQQGVNLGEMQAKLLQKVEEMTLYMIQLEEDNKKLKNEIDKIKAKME